MTASPGLLPASAKESVVQTKKILVSGSTGTTIKVASVVVTSDTAGTVELFSATQTRWPVYLAIDGTPQFVAPLGAFLFSCVEGEDLTFDSDIASDYFIHVLYQQE